MNRQPGIVESPQQAPELHESDQAVAPVSVHLVAQTCFFVVDEVINMFGLSIKPKIPLLYRDVLTYKSMCSGKYGN